MKQTRTCARSYTMLMMMTFCIEIFTNRFMLCRPVKLSVCCAIILCISHMSHSYDNKTIYCLRLSFIQNDKPIFQSCRVSVCFGKFVFRLFRLAILTTLSRPNEWNNWLGNKPISSPFKNSFSHKWKCKLRTIQRMIQTTHPEHQISADAEPCVRLKYLLLLLFNIKTFFVYVIKIQLQSIRIHGQHVFKWKTDSHTKMAMAWSRGVVVVRFYTQKPKQ